MIRAFSNTHALYPEAYAFSLNKNTGSVQLSVQRVQSISLTTPDSVPVAVSSRVLILNTFIAKITIFRYMTPCELVNRSHSLEGIYCLHRHGRNKKFWEELIEYFPLIRHKPHRKGRAQIFIYRWLYIHSGGKFFTEPLRSTDKGIRIDTETYEVDSWNGLRCHDIHIVTDLNNALPGNSSVNTVRHATSKQ
jgi:hypothetical protein